MKALFSKYWKLSLSILFGICVVWFWTIPYISVMSFQEQYQLFLFDTDYFMDHLLYPGGMAAYAGEFLTQFYFSPLVGACFLGLLYVLIQRLTWLLCRRNGVSDAWYPLTFVPSLMLWVLMSDENVMVGFIIALVVAMCLMLCYHGLSGGEAFPKRKWRKTAFVTVTLPLMYWLIGPCMLMVALYIAVFEWVKGRSLTGVVAGVVTLLYATAIVLACLSCVQYPLFNLVMGIGYYRYPVYGPAMQIFLEAVVVFLPFFLSLLPSKRTTTWTFVPQVLALVVCSWFFVSHTYDPLKYDLIEYDYLVRTHQWSKIVDKAKKKQPSRPFDVSCVNLALAMQGQLSDRLFEFFQNGAEGLFPSFQRDMTTPLPTSELFYWLGMVNEAERYSFEAQEAIPNHNKSGRLTKRIAECNMINGHYKVAMKYLRMLEKSLFYSNWAKAQMEAIRKGQVDEDPVYGRLRSYRQKKQDFLFSDTEMDQMLGLLFVQNYDNRMAFEYLMCYELLQRDLERFNEYYPLGKYAKFKRIPNAYQQALAMQWTQQHGSFEGMPWSIEPATCNLLTQFVNLYTKNPKDPSLSVPPLGDTFWSYMLVSQKGMEKKGKQQMKEIY